MSVLKTFRESVCAGVLIALGGSVFLGAENRNISLGIMDIGSKTYNLRVDGEFDDEEKSDDPNMFCNASVGARMSVILAGPFFNFILALILSIVMLSLSGIDRPVVNLVTDGYPAKEVGILPGDEIVKINNLIIYLY